MEDGDLALAARQGDRERVEALLRAGADVNGRGARTPLLEAARRGDVELFGALLRAEADTSLVDAVGGDSVLHAAARSGSAACVEAVLAAGVAVDVTNAVLYHATALLLAACDGHVACVEALLRAGADIDAIHGRSCQTALHLACETGHVSVVEALLQAGAEPNGADVEGMTALHSAAAHGHLAVAEALLRHGGVDVNAVAHGLTYSGLSALHFACASGSGQEMIEALLRGGADPSIVDNDGRSPLSFCHRPSGVQLAKVLLRAGTRVSAQDLVMAAAFPTLLQLLVSHSGVGDEELAQAVRIALDYQHFRGVSELRRVGAVIPPECGPGVEAYERYRAERAEQRHAFAVLMQPLLGRVAVRVVAERFLLL